MKNFFYMGLLLMTSISNASEVKLTITGAGARKLISIGSETGKVATGKIGNYEVEYAQVRVNDHVDCYVPQKVLNKPFFLNWQMDPMKSHTCYITETN